MTFARLPCPLSNPLGRRPPSVGVRWSPWRSSDHGRALAVSAALTAMRAIASAPPFRNCLAGDRKSTRLNSSHVKISYAVFCLKHEISAASIYKGKDKYGEIEVSE